MLNNLIKDLFLWLYSLFLDLISYCANALLGVMTTDLTFFETRVPVVLTLYGVMRAVGWGLLIGNCAFQAMRAMLSGLGFEAENPAVLLVRTGIFGFLLVFSKSLCDVCLSIGKNVIDIIGIPDEVDFSFPTEDAFGAGDAAWLLVVIVGFVLGFQLIKLFFEIGERYVVVALLTLMSPVGLAMGGSKTTKEICTGYLRCYGSMILLMVMNVVFLKLILSALSFTPDAAMVLPWCVLVVALARVARKADSILVKIGLNPAITGDPLGKGRGGMIAAMAARTIISGAMRSGKLGSKPAGNTTGRSHGFSSGTGGQRPNYSRQQQPGAQAAAATAAAGETAGSETQNNRFGSQNTSNTQNNRSTATSRSNSTVNPAGRGGTSVNTNRFGGKGNSPAGQSNNVNTQNNQKNSGNLQNSQSKPQGQSHNSSSGKGNKSQKGSATANKNTAGKPSSQNAVRSNPNSFGGKAGGAVFTKNRNPIQNTGKFGDGARPVDEKADRVMPGVDPINTVRDGEDNGEKRS